MRKLCLIALVACIGFFGIAASQEKKEAEPVKIEQAASDTVRLTPVKPYSYCALEMKGSFDQHGAAFQNLYQQAGTQGLPMTAVPFGIYWNDPRNVPVDSLKWELGFALPETRTLAAPLVLKKWEFPMTASTSFEGVYGSETQTAAYGRLFAWIGKNGYQPAGPLMEKFITMPVQDAEGRYSGKVEIAVPVAPAK
jgi:effector-binding domain-containing protein